MMRETRPLIPGRCSEKDGTSVPNMSTTVGVRRVRPLAATRNLAIDRNSTVVRKHLDWVVEAAHRIFSDAFWIEIAHWRTTELTVPFI